MRPAFTKYTKAIEIWKSSLCKKSLSTDLSIIQNIYVDVKHFLCIK